MKELTKKEWQIVIIFVIIKLLIHFLTNGHYDLHRDTFLYYSLSENLDWGYASVPPFIGLITKVSTLLFGYSSFSLNFFPAVAGAVSIIYITLIIKEFGGKTFALVIGSLAFLLSPAYLRSNSLLQPVSFDELFWLISAYYMVRLVNSQQPRYWIYLMITWAVGFLNKYLIACLAVSFILGLLITKHRKLIWFRQFILGILIGFIIILPNLIWQYNHNWAVFHHLSELNRNQLVNVSLTAFFIDQVLMNLPGFLVWVTGVVVFLFAKEEKEYRIFSWTYIFVIILLVLSHGKSYYTLGIYTLVISMGAWAVEKYYSLIPKILVVTVTVVLALPVLPFSLPVLSLSAMEKYSAPSAAFTNRWEDGHKHLLPQDYADMTGWKQLSSLVIQTYDSLPPEEQKKCAIYAENYGQAGAVYYYGRAHHLPRPISFSDNFLLWAPDSVTSPSLIYINDEVGDIKLLFKKLVVKGRVEDKYFRENGLMVLYCTQPNELFKKFYQDKVKALKTVYKGN